MCGLGVRVDSTLSSRHSEPAIALSDFIRGTSDSVISSKCDNFSKYKRLACN